MIHKPELYEKKEKDRKTCQRNAYQWLIETSQKCFKLTKKFCNPRKTLQIKLEKGSNKSLLYLLYLFEFIK